MFLLGIISLLQIIILPGFLLIKYLKIKTESRIQFLLYSFGLSLYSNFLVVCTLTYLKLYTSTNIYVLFIIEIILALYLILRSKLKISSQKSIRDYYLIYVNYFRELKLLNKITFIISSLTILFFISLIFANVGTIFYFNDGISRNIWIVSWASNKFPLSTGHYPQLLMTNMSLSYVFMHSTALEFFPKAFMPLFLIGILLIFFDLSIKSKNIFHLIGLIVYGLIIFIFYSLLFSSDFNTDIPTSFFGFLTFYVIIRDYKIGFNVQTILLTIVFASSAANTKLAGLYIFTMSMIWVAYALYNNRKSLPKNKLLQTAFWILIIMFGNMFWYLIKPVGMYKGLNAWISMLNPSYYERFINAVQMLFSSFGFLLSLYLLATIIFSLFEKKVKYLTLLMILPPLFLWIFFYSYDFRNLSFVIPFIVYASSFGLCYFYKNNPWIQRIVTG